MIQKKSKIWSFTIALMWLLSVSQMYSQTYYVDYNVELRNTYQQIIDLRFEEALVSLEKLRLKDDHNLAILHLENYIDFFTLFIDESEDQFKKRKKNLKKRLKLLDKLDDKSPYKLFIKAEIKLQWAVVASKFGEQMSVMKDIYSAYRALKENQKAFPEFSLNNKSLSVIHAVNETLPLPKIIKSLFALEGSIERGEEEIKQFIAQAKTAQSMFYSEAIASYAAITLYQRNDKNKAFRILKESELDASRSPLVSFLYGKIAQRAGYNDEAITYLSKCPSDKRFKRFDYINFLKGLSALRKLELGADSFLLKYVNQFEGRLYIKEAFQKLAWYELIMNNDIAAYKQYMRSVEKYGTKIVDDDKQAADEAKSGNIPNPEMLKARLLFDGGYYQRSFNMLVKNEYRFIGNRLELEYLYRMGRATQLLENFPESIEFFKQTISTGEDSKEYYPCNAALQLGIIYEQLGDIEEAKKYFNTCISMRPNKYKNSLHHKAKAGLDRISA